MKHWNKPSLRLIFVLLLLTATLHAAEKPNILFFLVDDMGWQDTSVPFHTQTTQLNKDYHTPNMEKLARQSLLFTNAYAYAICSPSRISLMTGQNAARHKVTCWTLQKNVSPESKHKTLKPATWPYNGLQPVGAGIEHSTEAVTMPELLRNHGYRTIHAGKAHFGAKDTPGANPKNLGFDVNIAGSYMGGPGSYHGDKNFSAVWRKGSSIWDIPGLEKYHGQKINLTEAVTREAIAEVEKAVADKKPFYLYMSHYAVHAPFEPDRRFLPNYSKKKWNKHKKIYASMLESMDKSLGDLLATLDRLNIADNTIVVFMSDNGSHANNPRNLPLRGHKISAYEGGTRVPLMVSLPKKPGKLANNQQIHTPVIIEDIFPTFLDWAGIKPPENDGVSFASVTKKSSLKDSKRPLFWHYPNLYYRPPYSSVRQGDFKLIYWHATRKLELFNLRQDIGEKNNIADKQPKQLKRLAELLSSHLRETKALMPVDKATNKPVALPDETFKQPANTDTWQAKLQPYTADNRFSSDKWHNWGGSIIKGNDGKYHLFYSRFPLKIGFLSWLTHSEIAVAVSDTPHGPWKYKYTALDHKHEKYITAHNPKIKKFGDTYYLYYICTHSPKSQKAFTEAELKTIVRGGYRHPNWSLLRNNMRTFVATSKSVNGPWLRAKSPIVDAGPPIHNLDVNPAVAQRPDGTYLMMIKGDSAPNSNKRIQALALSKKPAGPYKMQPQPAITDIDTEDASLWYDNTRKRFYAVFHAHKYYGLITSTDGIHWKKAKHYIFNNRSFPAVKGKPFKSARMERPNVYTGENGIPTVFITSCKHGNHTSIFTIPLENMSTKE